MMINQKQNEIYGDSQISTALSVVIICKNEEKNIARCLASVSFANEVILVDSGSTDRTLEIAQTFSNVKIFEIEWRGFVETKRFGIAHATYDWILWLDADEVVTPELQNEWVECSKRLAKKNATYSEHKHTSDKLEKNPKENNNTNYPLGAISVPRKTFFLGHWVKHSGWYPSRVVRFFNKKRADFGEYILHEKIIVKNEYRIENFSSHLLHYSYSSVYQYFSKMNQYGLTGAQEIFRKQKKVYLIHLFLNPLWTFFKFYFLKKGFLDGLIGIIVCVGAAFSNFIRYSNYFLLKKYGYVERTPEQD